MTGTSKVAGLFVSAMLAAGAAQAAPGLSPDLQKQASAMRLTACLVKAAHAHDNGRGDPQTIAARIAPLCQAEFAREEAAYGAGLSGAEQVKYRAIMRGERTAFAAEIVEQERDASHRVAQSD